MGTRFSTKENLLCAKCCPRTENALFHLTLRAILCRWQWYPAGAERWSNLPKVAQVKCLSDARICSLFTIYNDTESSQMLKGLAWKHPAHGQIGYTHTYTHAHTHTYTHAHTAISSSGSIQPMPQKYTHKMIWCSWLIAVVRNYFFLKKARKW